MKSLAELQKIKAALHKTMQMRKAGHRKKIIISMGTCGIAAGARDTMQAFISAIAETDLDDVAVTIDACRGLCEHEPLVTVEIAGTPSVSYGKVDAAGAGKIVVEHLQHGNIVSELQLA